ncbi:YdeI/OmpD-associated family protein [Snuella sedimenti]|uniref:DUF1905 domain-containing protein n=1 Tax=Snuella sedimenti TaxID=2798802 RepID=A0A8J7J1G8_9FLAO|nr:YdeI/OmpD-associated family protein [Snuella sedimenti]MBJ6367927.1 DUF1905 domain-containing protein [Snuella sedimenti]
MTKFIINKACKIQKFPGKGGWHYVHLPEISPNKNMPFGWVIVSGHIDTYKISKYKLLPLGNGQLFLPIKLAIRKHIKKKVDDKVHLKLYLDQTPLQIPKELILCFENEPQKAFKNFTLLSEINKKRYLDWIYSAKTEETKAKRIVKLLDDMNHNKKFDS